MFTLYLRRLRRYAKHNLSSKSWLLPSGQRPVIELLGDTVGSVEDVLEHNTLLPLTARFLETDDHLFVKAHFLGDPHHGLQAKLGMNGPRSGWSKVRLLRCPECMKEDIACCGNPFWRRDHLVPGLLFCGKHGVPLHEACEECMDFAMNPERVLHAGHHCGCGLKPIGDAVSLSSAQAEIEIEVAKAASQLLNSNYLPRFDQDGIRAAVEQATVQYGIVSSGQVDKRAAVDFFNASPLTPTLRRTGLNRVGPMRFAKVLRGDEAVRHPAEAIMLLIALYGKWRAVEDVFHAGPRRPQGQPKKPETSTRVLPLSWTYPYRRIAQKECFDRDESRHILCYSELRQQRPELSHDQLQQFFPWHVRQFLSRARLTEAGVDVPVPKFGIERDKKLDVEFARHIDEQGRRLRDSQYSGRICKRVLVRGFRRSDLFGQSHLNGRLGESLAAVSRNKESKEQWKARTRSRAA
ncbi:TniQ family protein [Paraburkholderia sp. J41]|uniref:TniQ family protein n=1 Tax=Paraburkholderia sp. J41 TaxID=2805433 RepID=UPI002AC35D64|nr:TniQ family protein [Paraburkholderia sp. J41]